MQVKSISIATLIALFASSTASFPSYFLMRSAFGSSVSLSPLGRVLAQSTETNTSEAVRLLNLCRADINKKQYQAALQSCQLAAKTAQGMGDRITQAKSLNNLGQAYQNTGKLQQALSNYQQALFIAQAIKERVLESKVLINLGEVANKLGETAKAKASFEQALRIAQEIKDAQLILAAKQAQLENNPQKAEADKLIEQGNKRLDTSQFRAALGSYEQALKIYQSIKDQKGEENALNGVGLAYDSLRDYKKAKASKEAVTKLMQKASIIHLATHGLLDNSEEPGIPGAVALGGENGLLSANEVLNFQLNAQLVVLSACDTGRGRITEDSVLGFPRALITAGVPSIIVSLWEVSDNSTVFLMPEFYRQWKNNPDKARALRAAMLETKKRYPDPSDWAAFVFIGEAE